MQELHVFFASAQEVNPGMRVFAIAGAQIHFLILPIV
jgi:hypothetical protein